MKIVVGVDGSPESARAVEWCAVHAASMGAEVVVVHAIEMPVYAASGFGAVPLPVPAEPDREALRTLVLNKWCAPMAKANVQFRVVVTDGSPVSAIIALADKENADLVFTGRRGRGGFAELLLGSTSHQLAHHLQRPLVIVP
jgi:nucleotide-binding universal stress UspA family protein